jgi:hypothetical protein
MSPAALTLACAWGYDHTNVNRGWGEYARDEDGDGFCEVHALIELLVT